jgi:hypothetical protein
MMLVDEEQLLGEKFLKMVWLYESGLSKQRRE